MTILRVNTIAGTGTTFGPTLEGNLEFNSQNYIVLPKGTTAQEGVLRTTADVVGTGGTFYDNLVLAMPFNAATGLTDVSSRNRNPAAYGNVAISTAQSKFYGSSAYFDGNGDYLSIVDSEDFKFGTGDFTIEFWRRRSRIQSIESYVTKYNNVYSQNSFWFGNLTSGAESFYWYSGSNFYSIDVYNVAAQDEWGHLAAVRHNGIIKLYLNGVVIGSDASANAALSFNNDSNPVIVGGDNYNGSTYDFQGYLQDLRIYKGVAKYTANFTPPERIAEIGVGFKAGQLRYNTDSNKVELYDGSQWTEVQASRPDLNGGARGIWEGGSPSFGSNVIEYVNISSTGNSQDFGDLTVAVEYHGACASSTRGVFGGGRNPAANNTIDYITISSTGNALDFGDLTQARLTYVALSNATRGIFPSGYVAPANVNTIDYVTLASTGNAVDFGDITTLRRGGAALASPTRGIYAGGYTSTNVIEFLTISTLGNMIDFGDLTQNSYGINGSSNATRGIFGGVVVTPGSQNNTMSYITIATLGNAVKFGELTVVRSEAASCSSSTRGLFGGGYIAPAPASSNVIDYVTILTQGNAVDFGDLLSASGGRSACSNAHGGL